MIPANKRFDIFPPDWGTDAQKVEMRLDFSFNESTRPCTLNHITFDRLNFHMI